MEIKKGANYKIVINSGAILTFIATIISYDDTFLTFVDIKRKTYTFNKNVIVSLTPYNKEEDKEGKNGEYS